MTQPVGAGGTMATAYTYTDRNEIASETDPADAKHLISYSYDAESRQVQRNDLRNGIVTRTIQETRRADGLVTERSSYFTGTTTGMHRGTFAYDANQNITSVSTYLNGSGTPNLSAITVDYTTADEISTWTETLHPTSGSAVSKVSSFTYAPDGALASRTVDGQTTTYTHWRNGLEKTTVPWGSAGTVSSTWMPNASPSVVSQPGDVATTYTYDAAARLSSKRVAKDGSGLSVWQQVTYDGDDNRTGELVSQAQPDGGTKMGTGTYAYDQVGRLVSATHPLEATAGKTYVLDDAGNIVNDGETAYHYTHNRLTRAESVKANSLGAGVSFAYDGQGNMTGQHSPGGSVTFDYDGASNTTRQYASSSVSFQDPFTGQVETYMTSEDTVRFAYDALGRMVRRRETHWTWETGTSTHTESLYFHFHDRAVQQRALETTASGSVNVRYVLDSKGSVIGRQEGSAFGWFVTDLRDNLTQVLDGTGNVKSVYGYDPFGRQHNSLTSTTSGFDSALRYQLAPRDPRTGVYTLGPRLHDPAVNRFVGADFYVASDANMELALDPLTGNRYLYAGANPAGMVDDGHSPSGMNGAEEAYCRWPSRWRICNAVREIRDRIRNDEGMRFPKDAAKRNAYRHCCWAGEMTIRLGEKTARGFLDRHEQGADPHDPDHQADLRNNESGIRIAHSLRGTTNERAAAIEYQCYRAADEGRLVLVG